MGVLELSKLVELLNAKELQRCGCPDSDLQQILAGTENIRRVKTTPGRYSTSRIPCETRSAALQTSGASTHKTRRERTSDDEEIIFNGCAGDSDDESASSDSSQLCAFKLDPGPADPPAKTCIRTVQRHVDDQRPKAEQSISWELPPLAVPAPSFTPTGTSMWLGTSSSRHALTPRAGKIEPLFSCLLDRALAGVASAAQAQHEKDMHSRNKCLRQQSTAMSGPRALEVPRTQLTPARENTARKLSAAEIWLGADPSD